MFITIRSFRRDVRNGMTPDHRLEERINSKNEIDKKEEKNYFMKTQINFLLEGKMLLMLFVSKCF